MSDERSDLHRVRAEAEAMRASAARLAPYQDLFPQPIRALSGLAADFERNAAVKAEAGRKLRVGIVGQVKAGKSSFLNALLFDGQEVLPQAATPMTAALTVIRHAPETRAVVKFYEEPEWAEVLRADAEYGRLCREARERLEAQAAQGGAFGRERSSAPPTRAAVEAGLPEECLAAHELVEMVRARNLRPEEQLRKKTVAVEGGGPLTDLRGRLEAYVGADGAFTPLVRSTELYYAHPYLEDLEIVDTPGINDPVISRGRATRSHLGECDAVLVLSSVQSSFLDAQDTRFLVNQLPASGIKTALIVGTKLDLALLQEHHRHADMTELVDNVEVTLEQYVTDTLSQLEKGNRDPGKAEVLRRLRESCTPDPREPDRICSPVFVSAYAHGLARRFGHLSPREADFLARLDGLYGGFSFTAENLDELANIGTIDRYLRGLREKKLEILAEALDELVRGARAGFGAALSSLAEEVRGRLQRLENEDVQGIAAKEKDSAARIESGRGGLDEVFETATTVVRRDFSLLQTELKSLAQGFSNVSERTESHTVTHEVQVPREFWGFDVSWAVGYRTETRTRVVTTRYAEVHEAIDKVEQFATEVELRLKRAIVGITALPKLKEALLTQAMKLFDLDDTTFDAARIEGPMRQVRRAVEGITLPEVDFGDRDYSALITAKFTGGRVTAGAVDELRTAQKAAVREVLKDLESAVRKKTDEIVTTLEKTQREFADSLLQDIQADLARLRAELQDKQQAVARYKEFLGVVEGEGVATAS